MPARPVTDAERARVAELHAAGASLSAVAAEVERSRSTIHRIAKSLGLTWDREQTQAATAARQADNAARRAELARLLLDDAHRLRAQLWQPAKHLASGVAADGDRKWVEVVEHAIDEPSFADKRQILAAVGVAVDKVLRIEAVDSEAQGLAAVDEWLRGMLGGD